MADILDAQNTEQIMKDDALPIEDLLQSIQKPKDDESIKKDTDTSSKKLNVPTGLDNSKSSEINYDSASNLTPLERLRKQREEEKLGLQVENKDLKNEGELKNFAMNDDRMEEMEKRVDEFDDIQKKREAVALTKPITDELDQIKAVSEIDSVQFDAEGNAIVPEGAEFIRPKAEDEDIFGRKAGEEAVSETKEEKEPGELEGIEIPEENKKIAQVLIDKTGLGNNWQFTPEEKAKIEEAEVIKLNSVKTIDISTILSKKSNKTFHEVIGAQDTSGVRTKMALPASGYQADFKGLSFGEYQDVALAVDYDNNDFGTFDQNYRRLSIIYNKMTNISCGSFNSFEDFLKNTAYSDIDLCLYALMISTEPETSEIELKCQKCGNNYNHKYSPRSLIQFKYSGFKFMDRWKKIVTAAPSEYEKLHENSMVEKSVFVELPNTKFICEVGIASAYEFLYTFIPITDPERFDDEFGADENGTYKGLVNLLLYIRSIRIPDEEGNYYVCEGYKDIMNAVYSLPMQDLQIVIAYSNNFIDDHAALFGFTNCKCTHCGEVRELIPANPSTLVFQSFLHSMNTNVDANNLPQLSTNS